MPQLVVQIGSPAGASIAVQARVLDAEGPAHRPHGPRPARERAEQIDAVDPFQNDAGSPLDGDALVDARHVRSGLLGRRQRGHLPLDHCVRGRLAREPEHASILPGEDLGLAPRSEQLQVASRHRARS